MMNTYRLSVFCLAVSILAAGILGCANPLQEKKGQTTEAGKGFVRLQFTGAERTLFPDGGAPSLARYTLAFDSDAGTHTPIDATELSGLSQSIELEAGTWTLTLKGFTADNNEADAEGSATVLINARQTSTAKITLASAGQGNLSYDDFLTALQGQNLIRASFTLTSLADDTSRNINLLDARGQDNPGFFELDSGYYRLSLDLYSSTGISGKTDIVHIYKDKITRVPYGMGDFTFIDTVYYTGSTLAEALDAIGKGPVKAWDNFTIILNSDEPSFAPTVLSYNEKQVTLTIVGNGTGADTIHLGSNGSLFTIEKGVTLILKGVALEGFGPDITNDASLVMVNEGGTFIMEAGTAITGNSFYFETYDYVIPEVLVLGGGVCVNNGASFVMNGGFISNNKAGAFAPNRVYVFGGGVYVGIGASFILNSGLIRYNEVDGATWYSIAKVEGSGIFVDSGVFMMNGGNIDNNTHVDTYSNEVYICNNATFTMNGGIISDNVGNGVNVYNSSFTMTGGSITNNSAESVGVDTYGVQIFDSVFVMDGGSISNNISGVHLCSYDYESSFIMSGGTICNNSSYGVDIDTNGTFTMTGGTISGNKTNGIRVSAERTFTMENGSIKDNEVGVFNAGSFIMNGGSINNNANGGVFNWGADFTMNGGSINNNVGGGISNGGIFIMNDGTINNNSTNDSGAGVDNTEFGTFTMNGGLIDSNVITSLESGSNNGGAGVRTIGSFIMNGGAISNNTTAGLGGGILVRNGNWRNGLFTMYDGTIYGNDTGVCIQIGTFIMYGGAINGNYNNGVILEGISKKSVFTMYDGEISGNTGSGVFMEQEQGAFTLKGGSITNNIAPIGGGVCVVFGNFIMNGGIIGGNIATSEDTGGGGGVWVSGGLGTFTKVPAEGGTTSGIVYGAEADLDAALKNTAYNNRGHALICFQLDKKRNATLGETDTLVIADSSDNGFSGWE